jgi:hypothetical protein
MMAEIIMKLRASPSTAAIFGDRVSGSADETRPPTYAALAYPSAFVVYLGDDAEPQAPGANENQQRMVEHWGIIVALEATEDIRGQAPAQQIRPVRDAVYKALYNWAPNRQQNPMLPVEYLSGNLWYESCKLIQLSRAATFWLLTFGAHTWICGAEGELDQFEPPHTGILERIHVYNDWTDPHDPGLPPSQDYGQPPVGPPRGPAPWPTGPEGRIESEFHVELPTTTPSPRGTRNGTKH